MSDSPHTLRIPGCTRELARVRIIVADWAREAGLGESAVRDVQHAVDEAVANAIEHGLRSRPDAPRSGDSPEEGQAPKVTLTGDAVRGGLEVRVRHPGDPFDPTAYDSPTPADAIRKRLVHGYGLTLLHRLVDDVAFRFIDGENEITLFKQAPETPRS